MKKKDLPPPSVVIAHYVPHAEQGQTEVYAPMLQGPATNTLAHTSARKDAFIMDAITKVGTLESGELKLFIDGFEGSLRISARKLLDALAIELTKQTNYRGSFLPPMNVALSLERYMEICGQDTSKKGRVDEARKRVKEDMNILFRASFEWRGEGRDKGDFLKSRICTDVAFKKGTIQFNFSPTMAAYLQQAYLMQYNMNLFKIDGLNPHTWLIARKLNEHHSMDSNKTAGTANTLSVASLLKAAPDIPSHEEVAKTDRHFTKRIITPLETSLDQLIGAGFLSEWTYWNSRNTPLTDGQLAALDYNTFIKLYVHFEFAHTPPDQTPRLEAKKTRPVRKKPTKARA